MGAVGHASGAPGTARRWAACEPARRGEGANGGQRTVGARGQEARARVKKMEISVIAVHHFDRVNWADVSEGTSTIGATQ